MLKYQESILGLSSRLKSTTSDPLVQTWNNDDVITLIPTTKMYQMQGILYLEFPNIESLRDFKVSSNQKTISVIQTSNMDNVTYIHLHPHYTSSMYYIMCS